MSLYSFFMRNIVFVYFFYGLAFFALGLVVSLESSRASEFRFARALRPLAAFGFLHGFHEWYEMFQIFAAHESGHTAGVVEEGIRIGLLSVSFLCLLAFGIVLLPDAERNPRAAPWRVAALGAIWLAGVGMVRIRFNPVPLELLSAADVLARYGLGIPSALLASWALLRERRDFHARGMSAYGQALLWAALAFFIYGAVSQIFTRPSLLWPSQVLNTALFMRLFGVPVQLVRGMAAVAIAITLSQALRAFEHEKRLRLERANQARLEAQSAALLEQARRIDETQALNRQLAQGARELSALVEMSRILASTVDLQRILDDGLYQIVHSFSSACCSVLFLKRPDGGLALAARYRRPNAPRPVTLPPVTCLAMRVCHMERAAGADLAGEISTLGNGELPEDCRYRTVGVPVHAKGRLFGSLVLSSLREDAPFGGSELSLLLAFGQQLASSIENADLYVTLQEREARLEDLVHQLVKAQEDERQRIARELHDEAGQKLSALAMGLGAVEGFMGSEPQKAAKLVRDLRELTDSSIGELRNIMTDLRPAQLDDLGLVPALRWYVQRFMERHPEITVTLNTERSSRRLSPQYETIMFRVAQEALTNVARHAHATKVDIGLRFQPQAVSLTVVDNGVGFELPDQPRVRDGSGWGLVGIRERVALVAGQCKVESAKGKGTCILVELPLKEME